MTKAALYRRVALLRGQWGLAEESCPFNVPAFLPQVLPLKVQRQSFETAGLCGLAFLGPRQDTIILNSARTPAQQNFDCAHEAIHLALHRSALPELLHCFETPRKSTLPALEWQANTGAAELLVPYRLFLPLVKQALPQLAKTPGGIYALRQDMAERFAVPEATIAFRFEDLRYELYQYLQGTPLDALVFLSAAQQKKRGISVPSMAHFGNLRIKGGLSISM